MAEIKLISLDVDGTLLSSSGELPPRNKEAIRAAIVRDVRVVLNTGKPYCTLKKLAGELELIDPISCLGGALILDISDPDQWRAIHSAVLPGDLLSRLKGLVGELPLSIQINTENGDYFYHNKKTDPEYLNYFYNLYLVKNGFPSARTLQESPLENFNVDPSPVIKVTFHSDEDDPVDEAFKRIKAIEDEIVMIGYSCSRTIDISPRPSGKLQAIQFLCERFNLGSENVMALGDYETDLELINWAEVGVVMANAPDFVRAKAPLLAPTNDQAGVAQMIETHVL
jgi:Cof subfamily protein (haloacid dehalogenase superfamily)